VREEMETMQLIRERVEAIAQQILGLPSRRSRSARSSPR
jgi:hypothetical protein